jgi:protein phosphatase
MLLTASAQSDVGLRRTANEDSYTLAPDLGLYVVADGMGGHTAGKVASELASESTVHAMRQVAQTSASLTERLRYCVSAANRNIFEAAQAKPELAGMGTTLVAVLAGENRIAMAHVGDSRAYLIRSGWIRCLTNDHSVVAELVRRRDITEKAARGHPHRHVLTRAVGVRRSVEADYAEMTPEVNDVLVMCSDGLTGHLEDTEIAEIVIGEGNLDTACTRLVELANARGGEDNITVALVRCDELDGSDSYRSG